MRRHHLGWHGGLRGVLDFVVSIEKGVVFLFGRGWKRTWGAGSLGGF